MIDELTQRPRCTEGQPYCLEEATCKEERAKEIGSRRFVSRADVGERAAWEGRLYLRVLCCDGSNHWKVSQQLNNRDRGVINALVGVWRSLERALTVWLLYLFCQASVIVLSTKAHRAGD